MYHLQCICMRMSMASPLWPLAWHGPLQYLHFQLELQLWTLDLTCGHIWQVAFQTYLPAPQCILALFIFVANQGSVTTTCKRVGALNPPSYSP